MGDSLTLEKRGDFGGSDDIFGSIYTVKLDRRREIVVFGTVGGIEAIARPGGGS